MSTNDGPQTFRNKIKSLTESRLSRAERQRQVGKAVREEVMRLKAEGKSNAEIAELMDIKESSVRKLSEPAEMRDIKPEETMWFPGIYAGYENSLYQQIASKIPSGTLISLVQNRTKADGEWAINNDFFGDSEDVMRKMMEWVSRTDNIMQCVEANPNETVDWVCRELAEASKVIANG